MPYKDLKQRKEHAKEYREKNREKHAAYKREWYLKNRERLLKKRSEYCQRHKEEKAAYDKIYHLNHKDEKRVYDKQYRANNIDKRRMQGHKYYEVNSEKIKDRVKVWVQNNREKANFNGRRRQKTWRLKKGKDYIRYARLEKRLRFGCGCCLYCGESDPFMLVEHHLWKDAKIVGRRKGFKITLCANHHMMIHNYLYMLEDWVSDKEEKILVAPEVR